MGVSSLALPGGSQGEHSVLRTEAAVASDLDSGPSVEPLHVLPVASHHRPVGKVQRHAKRR